MSPQYRKLDFLKKLIFVVATDAYCVFDLKNRKFYSFSEFFVQNQRFSTCNTMLKPRQNRSPHKTPPSTALGRLYKMFVCASIWDETAKNAMSCYRFCDFSERLGGQYVRELPIKVDKDRKIQRYFQSNIALTTLLFFRKSCGLKSPGSRGIQKNK